MSYEYKATVTKVYDGDTITVDIDLGFGVQLNGQKIRLYGINAPEVRGDSKAAGIAARDWLREKILGRQVTIQTHKDKKGKYGRWLGKVFIGMQPINDELVMTGNAEYREY